MKKYLKVSLLIITDIILINLAFVIALLLRFDFNVDSQEFGRYLLIYQNWAFFITIIKIAVNVFMGLYNSLWEYASIDEVFRVSIAAAFNFAAIILLMYYMQQMLPRSAYLIVFILDVLLLGGARIFYRILRRLRSSENGRALAERINLKTLIAPTEKYSRVLVIGAGQAGAAIIRELRDNPRFDKQVVGVIDDDPSKIGTRIMGKKVLGNRDSIPRIVRKRDINEIIIAIPSASRKEIQTIASICEKTGCKTSILPGYIDLIDGKVSIAKLREINVEDLLGREPVTLDIEGVSRYIKGKVVLVTGGGGSIGSELCRQLADLIPEKLVGMDIYENNLYELTIEIQSTHPELEFVPVIVSIRDRESLSRVFEEYRPDVVFHAAAHKHVPLMESNPQEALLNNIVGTKNVIDLSDEWGVEKFILISTDKAVNPTNVMGATKRVAEMLMQDKSHKSKTNYSAVRFGNVLGSNGSVVPLFQKQIEQGGPVTVTHPEVTRYFMTIPEAVQLVIQTGAMAAGGEIFVLDMGEPVKIKDLAESLIRLTGYTPYTDIDIVYTGLRPGEKLYEELLMGEEGLKETSHGSIFIGKPVPPTPALAEILNRGENALEEEVYNISQRSIEEIKEWLRSIVPNYTNGNGTTEVTIHINEERNVMDE